MKMIVTLTLIWMLSSTTDALLCEMKDETDNVATLGTCGFGTVCATVAKRVFVPGEGVYENVTKGCMWSFSCTAKTSSVKVHSLIYTSSTYCCRSNFCNSYVSPYPDVTTKNDLMCMSCGDLLDRCKLIQCVGSQDHCFESYFKDSSYLSGCASARACDVLSQKSPTLLKSPPKCCKTSFCNLDWNEKLSDDTEVPTHLPDYQDPTDEQPSDQPNDVTEGGANVPDLQDATDEQPSDQSNDVTEGGANLPDLQDATDEQPSDQSNDVTESGVNVPDCASAGDCDDPSKAAHVDQPSDTKCLGSSLCNSAWKVKLSNVPLLLGIVALVVY